MDHSLESRVPQITQFALRKLRIRVAIFLECGTMLFDPDQERLDSIQSEPDGIEILLDRVIGVLPWWQIWSVLVWNAPVTSARIRHGHRDDLLGGPTDLLATPATPARRPE
jgi:hypothetical protein